MNRVNGLHKTVNENLRIGWMKRMVNAESGFMQMMPQHSDPPPSPPPLDVCLGSLV